MVAILVTAVSLFAQAYLLRDLDISTSNEEVNTLLRYRREAAVEAALEATSNRWPAETDSSRTDSPMGGR